MDLRIQRTRKNIRDAFIELRSRKPIEKITVKELAEAAFINKATFYQHYEDLYDLSESMEDELIDNIIGSIPHPDTLLDDPEQATLEIFSAFFFGEPCFFWVSFFSVDISQILSVINQI